MTNFIEKFLSTNPVGKITKSFSSVQLGSNAGGLNNLITVMNDIYGVVSNRVQSSSELLPAFVHSLDILPDVSQMSAVLDENNPADFITEIDASAADVIESSMHEVIQFGRSISSEYQGRDGITITDKTGRVFELIEASGNEVPGVQAIIKTTMTPSSVADLLLYKENGHYKCNTLLRSKGFWRPDHVENLNNTIASYLYAACDWLETYDLGSSHLALARSIATKCNVTWTEAQGINDILHNVCLSLSLSGHDNTIYDNAVAIYNYAFDQQHDNDFGIVKFYGDVVSDLMVSDTINNVILVATDLLRNGRFQIEAFNTSVKDIVTDATVGIKKVVTGINSSFASGGVYGVCRYIITLIKQGTSLEYLDQDGVLQFTDNKNLVPTEYIAGMVTQVVGGIVTVVGLIVSIFSRIAGAVISILGSVLMAIPKAINYDYNTATWATFTTSSDDGDEVTALPYFPHGLYQGKMLKSNCNAILRNMFSDGITAFMLQVPGGIIMVGPDDNDAYVRYELHLAVCSYPYLRTLFDAGWNADLLLNPDTHDVSSIAIELDMTFSHFDITADDVVEVMNRATPLSLSVDGNGLISNVKDDARIRLCFMQSLAVFHMFAAAVDGIDISDAHINNSGVYSPILIQFTPNSYGSAIIKPYLETHANLASIPSYMSGKGYNLMAYLFMNDQVFTEIYRKELIDGTVMDTRINDNLYYHVFDDGYGYLPSWQTLVTIANQTNGTNNLYSYVPFRKFTTVVPSEQGCYLYLVPVVSAAVVLSGAYYINEAKDFPQQFTWCIQTPKYNRSTFMMWVFIATLVTVAVTVATVVATVKLRKAIRTKQAINSASVEQAWTNFTTNPTAENYSAYRSAVVKNNIFATITNGSKYSKTNYWAGDPSDSASDDSSGIIEKAQAIVSEQANEDQTLITANQNRQASAVIYQSVGELEGAISDQGAINLDTNTRLNSTQQNVEAALAEIFVIRRILKR